MLANKGIWMLIPKYSDFQIRCLWLDILDKMIDVKMNPSSFVVASPLIVYG